MTQRKDKYFEAVAWLDAASKSADRLAWEAVGTDLHEIELDKRFREAAKHLGYRLVPLTQDKPDSGRASIPETEPEVGERIDG